ncbi:DUF4412 domain-containing protein [Solitalea canadensis]|uniref:DUF4412 domain-containing protein n=1 Tax=Solitalea canadensis (strain ATCC 29591 / DSM 3403 / JCM 21819 / LMG 8368 / NBRC 15130 / NCIMB 12057 / USAM 9D) TaxID=929556 RepID=H8KNB4_SOLCM|nr:DUF4412 domain-containing protein [Solitalea canadensis]AFD09447.1 hypothetical protein Solca_4457 [Solitalea canadensis DSM 3403]
MKKLVLAFLMLLGFQLSVAQSFTGSFKMQISGDNMKQPVEMMCYYKDKKMATVMSPEQMKGGKVRTIFDYDAQETTMLMDMNGNKMGFKSKIKDLQAKMAEAEKPKITETNETRTIDGHICKKLISETEHSIIDMWIAQDMDFNLQSVFANMKGAKGGGMGDMARYAKYMKGPSLETTVTDKQKGTKTTIMIKDIQKGNIPEEMFSTEGYTIMDKPAME